MVDQWKRPIERDDRQRPHMEQWPPLADALYANGHKRSRLHVKDLYQLSRKLRCNGMDMLHDQMDSYGLSCEPRFLYEGNEEGKGKYGTISELTSLDSVLTVAEDRKIIDNIGISVVCT